MATELDAIKLADRHDPTTGRKLTSVDELINETIAGDARLEVFFDNATDSLAVAWEAVARDLARQVIDAEAENAEIDEVAERREDDETDIDAAGESLDWRTKYLDGFDERLALADLLLEGEQAHCDTYLEAVRLSEELAGWQNSSHAEYRRSTAAGRLADFEVALNEDRSP